ncbi:MAG: glycosyltransferase [Acidimicrobiales bacterium]
MIRINRTRVLAVVDGLGTGGAERSLAESIVPLRRRGIDISVVCFHRREEGVHDDVVASAADVTVIDETNWHGRVSALRRLVTERGPDVVHTTLFDSDVIGRLATRGTGVPLLTSLVNTSYDKRRLDDPNVGRLRLAGARLVDGFTGRRYGTHFHAISETVRDAAVDDLGLDPAKITVIPRGRARGRLGEATPSRRAASRAALGLAEDQLVVLNIGRHEYQKGQITLIEAAARLRRTHPDLVVLIAGRNGNATTELRERIAALDLDDTVRLLGHTDVAQPLAAADLFAFPSRYEGLGGSVLEAMALEVPIIASDIPVLREVLCDTAVFTPVDEVGPLAAAIEDTVADQAATRQRVAQARRRFDEHYEFDGVMDRLATLYEQTADPSRAPRRRDRIDRLLVRTPLAAASRALTRHHVTVLAYHGINDREAFAHQLDEIGRDRTFIGSSELRHAMAGGSLPERATLVTFDDGRRSVLDAAIPELGQRHIPAMLFVVTSLLDSSQPFWWDEAEYLGGPDLVAELKRVPNNERLERIATLRAGNKVRLRTPQLTAAELRELAAQGIEIGNHTATHPCLDRCDATAAAHEVHTAHEYLTDLLGAPPMAFAYPNGNFDPRVEETLDRLGYDLGFLFDHRTVDVSDAHPLRISRLRMNERLTAERLETILSGLHPALHSLRTRGQRRALVPDS